ncbi:hypothetical protein GEOBRER4_n1173 [Citrifermentans bremense]|uniref:Ice-binding protein C-terminal domain-containing protein n=1 Tax=Citrifermentans bremense TaxID=60035 RepID=A0A6S6LWH1_9BACT|nr:PEP-CTERM sorting domain-containing protein [Citrifermentans bremense]BCG46377.1 hypothetical protein GEOBRER4_n1173 [Citrifermentans bremense]
MKKLVAVLIMLATLAFAGTAQATMLNVADMKGSLNFATELQSVEFNIGNDYMYWGFGLPFLDPKQSVYHVGDSIFYDTFLSCLTRTYTPFRNSDGTLDDSNGWNYAYQSKAVTFYAIWCGMDQVEVSMLYVPIVDLTGYVINDLYLYTDILQKDDTLSYRLNIVADAKAVPEPSTALLFLAGMAGVIGVAAIRREALR